MKILFAVLVGWYAMSLAMEQDDRLHKEIKQAIIKHDSSKVHSFLQSSRTGGQSTATLSENTLNTLLSLAQEIEQDALAATGSSSRVARITGGLGCLAYAGASIGIAFASSLHCTTQSGSATAGTVLTSSNVLAPIAGGLYLIYTGITNSATVQNQSQAQIVTKLLQSHKSDSAYATS